MLYVAAACVFAAAAGGTFVSESHAKDSLAPNSAGDRWLPCERWVLYHWSPIDMQKLYAQTGITELELFDWLQDDDARTFGGLLALRGHDPRSAVRNALAVRPQTTLRTRRILIERANRLLTQGHLAQHVFFHWFHNPAIRQHSREIFGMNPWDYAKARRLGFSPADLGAMKKRMNRAQTASRVVRFMTRYELLGVRYGATTRRQADHYVASINALADVWLNQRYGKPKPTSALPRATKRGRRAAGTCRDFVGAGQVRDGFTKVPSSARALHTSGAHSIPGVCPLAASTRVSIVGNQD